MSNQTELQQSKNLTTAEKWKLGGHIFIAIGTLCLSISSLMQTIYEGTFKDLRPNGVSTLRERDPNSSTAVADYFRGRL